MVHTVRELAFLGCGIFAFEAAELGEALVDGGRVGLTVVILRGGRGGVGSALALEWFEVEVALLGHEVGCVIRDVLGSGPVVIYVARPGPWIQMSQSLVIVILVRRKTAVGRWWRGRWRCPKRLSFE